jgi:hypothetical protein
MDLLLTQDDTILISNFTKGTEDSIASSTRLVTSSNTL